MERGNMNWLSGERILVEYIIGKGMLEFGIGTLEEIKPLEHPEFSILSSFYFPNTTISNYKIWNLESHIRSMGF